VKNVPWVFFAPPFLLRAPALSAAVVQLRRPQWGARSPLTKIRNQRVGSLSPTPGGPFSNRSWPDGGSRGGGNLAPLPRSNYTARRKKNRGSTRGRPRSAPSAGRAGGSQAARNLLFPERTAVEDSGLGRAAFFRVDRKLGPVSKTTPDPQAGTSHAQCRPPPPAGS